MSNNEEKQFEITIRLTGKKQDVEEAMQNLKKLQWSFIGHVPEAIRQTDVYLQIKQRTFLALEKSK